MNITDHEIQAYVDGELAPEDAARLEAAIAADVMVAARVEREKRLRASLRGAYEPVLAEPVPDRLRTLLAGPAEGATARADDRVVELRQRRPERARRWSVPAMALAASIAVVAIVAGGGLRPPGRSDLRLDGGRLLAHGSLAEALEGALASEPVPGAPVRVGLTFRDARGRICRSFEHVPAAQAGLACRDGERWRIEVLATGADDGGELRQASGLPPELQAAVDGRLSDGPFDAARERSARDAGWR